jgi:hypothetical protein
MTRKNDRYFVGESHKSPWERKIEQIIEDRLINFVYVQAGIIHEKSTLQIYKLFQSTKESLSVLIYIGVSSVSRL